MGVYFNPDNESFTKDRNYKIYIDKTELLEFLNESIGTPQNCIAVSHARRFGKSHAAGGKVRLNVNTFKNDLSTVALKDNALTALIHLGYLGYHSDRKSAYIPNYEVASAFELALETGSWNEVAKSISKCDELLDVTIDGEADRVAELIELAHETYTSILKYNDENSLSCVLTMAYFTAPAYYNIVREFPAGKGFADMVFIPRANAGNRPAMVVELKYNQSADSAINQIKERRYQGALSGYSDRILLVGVNYDADGEDKKKHTCVIEEW